MGEVEGTANLERSYGLLARVEHWDADLVAIANGGKAASADSDDGDLNYGKGIVWNMAQANLEIAARWRFLGASVRGVAFYDFATELADRERTDLGSGADPYVGKDIALPEYYLEASFRPGGMPVHVRLGSEVLNWGESAFLPGRACCDDRRSLTRVEWAPCRSPTSDPRGGPSGRAPGHRERASPPELLIPAGLSWPSANRIGRHSSVAILPRPRRRSSNDRSFLMLQLLSWAVLALVVLAPQPSRAQQCSLHTFLGDSPDEGNPGWHEETQGLAHDRDNWYVTQNNEGSPPTNARLWRIPVTTDLASDVSCGSNGVSCARLSDLGLPPQYNHYGDPDTYEYDGHGYVLVPLEDNPHSTPGILIFRADETLEFLAFVPSGQRDSSWIAVDPDGVLHTSNFDTDGHIDRFHFDWALFQANGEHTPPPLVRLEPLLLEDEAGAGLDLDKSQGGEFSDDGQRLYLLNGDGEGDAKPAEGIHVFALRPGSGAECGTAADPCTVARQIEHSYNGNAPGFSFKFEPGGLTSQEPEGLTYWDLDADGRAPGMRGQLHAVLLDNDYPDADDVYIKHYSFADVDADPPAITCPDDAIAECTSPLGVQSDDAQLASFFSAVSATDACSGDPATEDDAPVAFPLGETLVTFTATDDSQNESSCQSSVTVVDTMNPTLSVVLSPETLWPPNHALVPITATITVADTCELLPAVQLVSITSSEPDDGTGDGNTIGDIQGADFGAADTSFFLRAERAGSNKAGRIYTAVYQVTDGSGNTSMATAYVRVPH